MILEGLDLVAGLEHRVPCQGYARVALKADADDGAGAVLHVRRAYGEGGPVRAYTTAVTLDISGETPTELEVLDCPELVVVVVSAGAGGSFDLEVSLSTPVSDELEVVTGSLESLGRLWGSRELERDLYRVSVVAESSDALTTGEAALRALLDFDGHAHAPADADISITSSSVTTIDFPSVASIEIHCTGEEAEAEVDFYVYRVRDPFRCGVLPENIAYTDQVNSFGPNQGFGAKILLGDPAVGISSIDTKAAANQLVEFPNASGEIVVVTDTPSAGDYLQRSGSAYVSTARLEAEDGSSSAPGFAFADDDDNGLFRSSADQWRAVVGGHEVIFFGTAGAGLFSTLVFDGDITAITASVSWNVTTPDVVITNSVAANGAKISLKEGTTNGTSEVELAAPASLASSYTLTLPSTQPGAGHGFFFTSAGVMSSSPWASAQAFAAEVAGSLSTTSNAGFQWSFGARAGSDGFGLVIPFDFEIIGITLSVDTNTAGTATVEVYKGTDESTSSSSTGVSVSLTSGELDEYADFTGAPVSGNKGDKLTFKTTAQSGTVQNGRVTVWIRPR